NFIGESVDEIAFAVAGYSYFSARVRIVYPAAATSFGIGNRDKYFSNFVEVWTIKPCPADMNLGARAFFGGYTRLLYRYLGGRIEIENTLAGFALNGLSASYIIVCLRPQ